jgi:hypothetical protein
VLVFDSPEQLRSEPEPRRFLHLVLLIALRDRAERVEFRAGEEGYWLLYQRVDGRDWELVPPPEAVQPVLKQTVREVSRLVAPERPAVTVSAGLPGARYEPAEVGWLTYQIGNRLADIVVRIDPREPWGSITLGLEHPDELSGLAADALAAYYEADDQGPE